MTGAALQRPIAKLTDDEKRNLKKPYGCSALTVSTLDGEV